MVDGARLESVYRGDSIVGSNPTVSATTQPSHRGGFFVVKLVRIRTYWFEVEAKRRRPLQSEDRAAVVGAANKPSDFR